MCGIAGYVGKPDKNLIERMTRTLIHRGPEDEGYFIDSKVALGMRRLKIIDLTGGRQPMFSENKKTVVVFNGEIYNFRKLRAELENEGVRFHTNSDTEVIVHGYTVWGTDIFARLDGMFGIALWDSKAEKLVLARDRFGEKPLYYGEFGDAFVFGSELKAMVVHDRVKRELNPEALARFLVFDYVPTPHSIFKNIFKLPPAHFLIYRHGAVELKNYWELSFSENQISQAEAEHFLEEKLENAVDSRMIADVPIGVFLSGGLDSSTIAYFAQKNSSQKIKTFSIGFEDESFDESGYARSVAETLGTQHVEHTFTASDMQSVIPEIFEKLDEPFADASILPTYLLSKFTREYVTVALDGDGSDELFGGYPTFQARKLLPLLRLLPKQLVNWLPTSFDNITVEYGLKRIAMGSRYPDEYQDFVWIGSVAPHELESLLAPELSAASRPKAVFEDLAEQQHLSEINTFQRQVYLYLKWYLTDDILFKSDRASMMVSLETRAPFLTPDLADFINSLPVSLKLRGFTTKYLLKRVMRRYLPPGIAERKKKGFGVPMARWLTGDLEPLLRQLLNRDRIMAEGYFQWPAVEKLIADHFAAKRDNRKALWALMAWQLWHKRWMA